jgi:8-oxo-dGTP pyrophosphatase MutT (NUDIX family)
MFLQGRYDGTWEGVQKLWTGMTRDEHVRLRSHSYRDLFMAARIHKDLWEQGQRMFQRAARYLAVLDAADGWETPEWGFPKGRKNHARETDRACAMRELAEETGMREEQVRVLPIEPIRERFQGTDKKWYVCDYYIAEALADPTLRAPPADDPEVSALCWLSAEEAEKRFRPWEPYRVETLRRAEDSLRNFAKKAGETYSSPEGIDV